MASAGRILIMPKGNYDASVTYEMLDIVFHNGTSWIAKKTTVGVEPNSTNGEYWQLLCASTDLTEIENRIKALEDAEDVDLSGYAKSTDVEGIDTRLSDVESGLNDLSSVVSGITSSGVKIATGSYTGTGSSGSSSPTTITFDFEPKVVFLQDSQAEFSCPVIWHKGVSMLTLGINGSNMTKQLQFSLEGNTLKWYYPLQESDTQLNNLDTVYHWVAIG
jgi:hypothetical protein